MRDSGAAEAVAAELAALQRALSCVTPAVLVRSPAARGAHAVGLRLAGDGWIPLRGQSRLSLEMRWAIAMERAPSNELGWQVVTRGYAVELRQASTRELIAWHWHPMGVSPIRRPHLHLASDSEPALLRKTHVPTGRVTLPAIVQYAITELGVAPRRADWRAVLDALLDDT